MKDCDPAGIGIAVGVGVGEAVGIWVGVGVAIGVAVVVGFRRRLFKFWLLDIFYSTSLLLGLI
jgi:hypothetical protein